MSDGPSADRLAQLRERWQADPSSRLFLQLAEEYRHLGRYQEALEVLDLGLKQHPGYLSALVAKGRCHLELGEPEAARDALERVVRQDAMHLVASKLLVRAHLGAGEVDRARERLDLYSLLNGGDPEVAELRREISRPPQTETEPPADGPELSRLEPFEEEPMPVPPTSGLDGDVFDLAPAAPLAGPDVVDGEPFNGLVAAGDHSRYLAGLASEGIFVIDVAPAPEPAASSTPAEDDIFGLGPAPAGPLPQREPQDEVFPLAPAPVARGEQVFAPGEPPPATVTLGELYLRQGHHQEAVRIFREVLRRDPDHQGAREGLARASSREAGRPLDAAALLEGFPESGQRDKKAFLLSSYLERLRRGSEGSRPDVP